MRKKKIDVYTIYIDGVLKNKQWRQDVHKSAGRDDGQRNHCGTHLASVVPLPPRKKKKTTTQENTLYGFTFWKRDK